MASNNSDHWTTNPEYIELLNFLIETTENVKSPMNMYQLALDFKKKNKTSLQTSNLLYSRICNARQTIHRVEGIENETKVKVLLALSAPIDTEFLKKLREHADVILDPNQRLVEYKRKGGGFELTRKPLTSLPKAARLPPVPKKLAPVIPTSSPARQVSPLCIHVQKVPVSSNLWTTDPEYIQLFNFLVEKTKNVENLLSLTQLAREFKKENRAAQREEALLGRIQRVRPKIHEMEHIDMDTKVKLLFALSAPIHVDFMKELKQQAEVVLDHYHRIIKYRENEGGLKLERIHPTIYEKSGTIRRDERMMEFLAKRAMNVNSPITDNAFVKEFKETTEAKQGTTHLVERYKLLKSRIHESTELDERIKLRMMFVSSASVPGYFLEILRKDALVEVDEKNRITKYRASDGSLELQGDHSRSAKCKIKHLDAKRYYSKQITNYFENKKEANDEMGKLIEFISEKCKNVADSPLSPFKLAKEFSKQTEVSTLFACAYDRMKGYCREIQRLNFLDTPTKVKQLFGLSAPLSADFLEGLRKEAVVEVDDGNRIIKYFANDGSLTLVGDHSRSAKIKRRWAERRKPKNNAISDFDDNEYDEIDSEKLFENSYAYSNDESYVDEPEDYVEQSTRAYNQEQSSKNGRESEFIKTGSGRVSKKRKLEVITSAQKHGSSRKRASEKSTCSSKQTFCFETDPLEEYYSNFAGFQEPEVKLEPFRESLIQNCDQIDPDNNMKVIPAFEFREPKKEVEEEQIDIEMMEFPIKTEEDFIIPKLEELEEEEDVKPEFTV